MQIDISKLRDIPTIPVVVTKAIAIINSPRSSARDLTDLIVNDQVLAAKILKVANSAYYGLPSKVNNLNRAITLIGFNEVKRMITPLLLLDTFKSFKNNRFFSSEKFWTHSLAVASASEIIASRNRLPEDVGEARVVGLLHDIGRLIIVEYFPDAFETVMANIEMGIDVLKAENAILGMEHGEAGAQVTETWNLPASVANVIRYHHHTEDCPEAFKMLAEIVRVADHLAYQVEMPSLLCGNKPELPDEIRDRYLKSEDDIEILITKLETEVEKSQILLNMIHD